MGEKYICENPNGYHYGCEVHNFSWEDSEPYEECGRYCDNCPYLTILKETDGRIQVIQSGYPDYYGDVEEPEFFSEDELSLEELEDIREGLIEMLKRARSSLKKEKDPFEREMIEAHITVTENSIEHVEQAIRRALKMRRKTECEE
ncbi:MAG: hypothetical protein QW334_00135 [Thermofilum sp.]